nr:hypothetical protein [Clavibacter michiganensis]
MTAAQLRIRTAARAAFALTAFTIAVTIITIALQNVIVGIVLAVILWAFVIRGRMWRY